MKDLTRNPLDHREQRILVDNIERIETERAFRKIGRSASLGTKIISIPIAIIILYVLNMMFQSGLLSF